ncbi:MAG: YkvA family protein [Candidatus Hydrothermarchaeales archaeon]
MSPKKESAPLFTRFYKILQESMSDYDGDFQEVVKLTPEVFKLFVNLLGDPQVSASSKPIINAAIAYFVAPFDVVPEEYYGPMGYLDDLFLCAWSLKKLEEQVGYEVLEKNWEGGGNLDTVIDEIYKKSKETIKGMEKDILVYVGLE